MGSVLSAPVLSKGIVRAGNKHYRVGGAEMQGFRMEMEDAHSVMLQLSDTHADKAFFAVFDGHGGREASKFLGKRLHEFIAELEDPFNPDQIHGAVLKADKTFMDSVEIPIKNHGSTACFAVVQPITDEKDAEKRKFKVLIGNVGDSRAIIMKPDGTVISLTEDHKPENPQERKRIMAAGGKVQSNRVDGQLAMSRAIGDFSYKRNPKLSPIEQKVIPVPDVRIETMETGDRLVLYCDGIVEQMNNEDAAAFVRSCFAEAGATADPASVAAKLLEYSVERGSKDNHSALVIDLADGTELVSGDKALPTHDYWAGPYTPYAHNREFKKAYLEDAKAHGISEQEVVRRAQEVEKTMPADRFLRSQPIPLGPADSQDEDNDDDANVLSVLQDQLLGGGGAALNPDQRMLALMAMLRQGGLQLVPGDGAEDEDDLAPLVDDDELVAPSSAAPKPGGSAAAGKKKRKHKKKKAAGTGGSQ